ncbi:efflux RND transporter permease subunit [Klebsiella pneumoniae]|nr:efflux RND transporter permease subunit [Klebsiella pneumoniae]
MLSAVFLPLAFMAGSVGIHQQFSLSLAVSILFSGFLALTFTPALCATLLKPIPKAITRRPVSSAGSTASSPP